MTLSASTRGEMREEATEVTIRLMSLLDQLSRAYYDSGYPATGAVYAQLSEALDAVVDAL